MHLIDFTLRYYGLLVLPVHVLPGLCIARSEL